MHKIKKKDPNFDKRTTCKKCGLEITKKYLKIHQTKSICKNPSILPLRKRKNHLLREIITSENEEYFMIDRYL